MAIQCFLYFILFLFDCLIWGLGDSQLNSITLLGHFKPCASRQHATRQLTTLAKETIVKELQWD